MQNILHSTFFNADILAGIVFLLMGLLIKWFPPRNRKVIYGYRSFMSTRSQETWDEANHFAGRHSLRIAYILIGIGIVLGVVFKTQSNWFYLLSVGAVIIAAMNLRGETEWYLSQLFEDSGERKQKKPEGNELEPLSSRPSAK